MAKHLIIVFVTIISVCFFGCPKDESPVVVIPPSTCAYPSGNRSFTWRLDTVAWFPSTVAGVWAFSDTDAYVMGSIVDGKPPYSSRFGRHWNGKIWEDSINGTWGYNNATGIWGDITIAPRNDVTGDNHFMVAVGYGAKTGFISAGIVEFDNTVKKWKSYEFQTLGELRSVWTDGKGYFITVGDSGMVYTKDGYSSNWIYQKVQTNFSFYKISGVSKNEIYVLGYKSVSGTTYPQIWKYNGSTWDKLLDDLDTVGTAIKIPEAGHRIGDLYAERCGITDSLRLYIIGWESNLFETKGSSLQFKKTNLTDYGLYLNSLGRTALRIFGFNLNDIWVCGVRYTFYHWNGTDFQPMTILGIPDKDDAPSYRRMRKTSSGKIFFPLEISSQVYVVAQGTP